MGVSILRGGSAVVVISLAISASAQAMPSTPTFSEPVIGATAHPADVHMEAGGYSDTEGDDHHCSDWEILDAASSEAVWRAECVVDGARVHAHLGDGAFVGALDGEAELGPERDYRVRVRFRDDTGEWGDWAEREFRTGLSGGLGTASEVPWRALQPGYRVEAVAGGLQLPVSIAVVPDPGEGPDAPVLYMAELYGTIKVLTRNGEVRVYAHDLLNFAPSGLLPGDGVRGIGGIAVEPASGDLFAGLVYRSSDGPDPKPFYAKVIRLESAPGGLNSMGRTDVLDLPEPEGQSHQISNLSIGPDSALYVHVGDGILDPSRALDLDSFLGKILRLNLDGSPRSDNPFYDGAPLSARDYIFAYGFRNPFGGAWRYSNGAHYEVENGPTVDRLARVERGGDYGWDGTDESMYTGALFTWPPATAPVAIDFIQAGVHGAGGFPADKFDHAFVTLSGSTWATGPQPTGKRIVEFAPAASGEIGGPAQPFIEYTGTGKATAAAIAAGPGGLYFTDLFKDMGASFPADPGAKLLRIAYALPPCAERVRSSGTRGADRLLGTVGHDRIAARAGADRVHGFAGADCLAGQGGRDLVIGGPGRDSLRGGPGNDRLVGGPGQDALRGGQGHDRLVGGPGPDVLRCGPGLDVAVRGRHDRVRGCERTLRRGR